MSDGSKAWLVIEPAWGTVSIYDGPSRLRRDLADVPVEVRHLLATHWCMSEVMNGGLLQFYWNGTGVLAPEALEGFKALEMHKLAGALRRSIMIFGRPYPRGTRTRRKFLAKITGGDPDWPDWENDPFDKIDQPFFDHRDAYYDTADRYAETAPRIADPKPLAAAEADKRQSGDARSG